LHVLACPCMSLHVLACPCMSLHVLALFDFVSNYFVSSIQQQQVFLTNCCGACWTPPVNTTPNWLVCPP
jgi:hypothetical protein